MSLPQLERLVAIRKLKAEPAVQEELDGLIASGSARLADSERRSLAAESRFDLAYNAAHALALAALRWHGYRPDLRYIVFQCLEHTVNLPPASWRVLDQAHNRRNLAEYEGVVEVDMALVEAMIRVTRELQRRVLELGPAQGASARSFE